MTLILEDSAVQSILEYGQKSSNEIWHFQSPSILGLSLQNFQGIAYPGISIPIRPLTLLFGQNSSGKSTISDAWILLESFFSPKADDPSDLLERWASRHRESVPVSDVRISATTFYTFSANSDWSSEAGVDSLRRQEFDGLQKIFGSLGPEDRSQFFSLNFVISGRDGLFYFKSIEVETVDGVLMKYQISDDADTAFLAIRRTHPKFKFIDEDWDGSLFNAMSAPSSLVVVEDVEWINAQFVLIDPYSLSIGATFLEDNIRTGARQGSCRLGHAANG